MRRLWMGASGILMLAACRAEGTNDRALGTERRPGIDTIGAQPSKTEKSPDQSAERGAISIARILGMIQAMDQGEIEMAKRAHERAASPDVKAYAAKLASEHQQDLDAMARLTQSKRIDLGAVRDDPLLKAKRATDREKMERLSRLAEQAFDEAYLEGTPGELALLSALANEGEELSKDNELDAFFRMVGDRAQDHRTRALAVQPRLCAMAEGATAQGGQRGPSGPEGSRREGVPAARSQSNARRPSPDGRVQGRTAPRGASPSQGR
jgi:predicted outer membrane protein